jgi:23S rRNA (cytosine1962-C5)-methyltransferase
MELIAPQYWKDYALLDCGGGEKLERFGAYTLIRPEPQAVWRKALPEAEWLRLADARFVRGKQAVSYRAGGEENGGWEFRRKLPPSWNIGYGLQGHALRFKLAFTSFGHVGLFPEQADNWEYIYRAVKDMPGQPRVLNLFAYTGGASLAANAAGADVTHLDAVRQVVGWGSENMALSGLDGIRWLVEDALKYVQREVKRGKRYEGIVLDPPAYGRGPAGEKWVLQDSLDELMSLTSQLLAPGGFLVLSLYSLGFSSVISENIARQYFKPVELAYGECYLPAEAGPKLPLGTFLRLRGA